MNELSLLDTFFNDGCSLAIPSFSAPAYNLPSVDVKQTKDAYIFEMDLPGMTEKDIEISLKENKLTVCSAEEEKAEPKAKNTEATEKKDDAEQEVFLIHERKSAKFRRSFTLPRDIDPENAGASFRNGVLVITVPRKPETEPRKITIQVA